MADNSEMIRKALKAVIEDMGKVARSNKAKKFARPAKAAPMPDAEEIPQVSEVEGGPTLAGVMNTPGNSGKDIADASSLSEEELQEILSGAK